MDSQSILDILPRDLILYVLSFLPTVSLFHLASCSKQWCKILDTDSIWTPRLPFRFEPIDSYLSPKQQVLKNCFKGEFFTFDIPQQHSKLSLRWHVPNPGVNHNTAHVTLFVDNTPLYSLGASQLGGSLESIFEFVSPTTDRIIVDEMAYFFNNGRFNPHGQVNADNLLSYLTPLFPSSHFKYRGKEKANKYVLHSFSCVPYMPHAEYIKEKHDVYSFFDKFQQQLEEHRYDAIFSIIESYVINFLFFLVLTIL